MGTAQEDPTFSVCSIYNSYNNSNMTAQVQLKKK